MTNPEQQYYTTREENERFSSSLLEKAINYRDLRPATVVIGSVCGATALTTTLLGVANAPLATHVLNDVSLMVLGHATAVCYGTHQSFCAIQDRRNLLLQMFSRNWTNGKNILTTTKTLLDQYSQKLNETIKRTRPLRKTRLAITAIALCAYFGVEHARIQGSPEAQVIADISLLGMGMAAGNRYITKRKREDLDVELTNFNALCHPLKVGSQKKEQKIDESNQHD